MTLAAMSAGCEGVTSATAGSLGEIENRSEYSLDVSSETPIEIVMNELGSLDMSGHTFTVLNAAECDSPVEGSRTFQVSTDVNWIQITGGGSATLGAGEQTSFSVGFDRRALAELGVGVHEGKIEIRDPSNSGFEPVVRRVLGTVAEPESSSAGVSRRVTDGLVALYEFEEGSGAVVGDTSGIGAPLDLEIENPNTVIWQPGALVVEGESGVFSLDPAKKITDAVKASGELTVEAWVAPKITTQSGPARIVTISDGAYNRNLTLGHGGGGSEPKTAYNVRLRSTETSDNGTPALLTGADEVPTGLHHVAYTRRADGVVTVYVDGLIRATGVVGGDLFNWDDSYRLGLGNEIGESRPWAGSFHLVALFDRALTELEVGQNFVAGSGDELAGSLVVSPASDYVVAGVTGDPRRMSKDSKEYDLHNPGTETISWSVSLSESWAYIDGPMSGMLAPGQHETVAVMLDGVEIAGFSSGTYAAQLQWTNATNGFGDLQLAVRLTLSDESEPGGKPGPSNTGPSHPESLVPSGSITAKIDGQVIENVDISGIVKIQANNVTIRNFRINSNKTGLYGIFTGQGEYSGTVIEDGEIFNIKSAAIFGKNFTARRLNIYESGGDAIKARGNVLVEGCWIHHLGTIVGAHADGNQTRLGANFVFRRNNFDMPIDQSGYRSNAAFMNDGALGATTNFLIEDNWMNGGNYTIMLGPGLSDVRIRNNRFGRDYRYGTLSHKVPMLASGNVWEDTGEPMSWNNQ